MTFDDAMYNCLLRRMELVAFDRPDELHRYWNTSSYYEKAMGIGDTILTFFLSFQSGLILKKSSTIGQQDQVRLLRDLRS
jgi:hypothetical protein